jgi:hypothetical protein
MSGAAVYFMHLCGVLGYADSLLFTHTSQLAITHTQLLTCSI